ncbi:B3 domain-containing protein [Zea mays]|jgi:hypothetical protein|uniref:B3 domain-containing protein n=1 Tax=Zea mays TaxID=4577 RepID=A0A3L6FJB0_MAIZE|nr:B3 domain-containing protein [Zea mays]
MYVLAVKTEIEDGDEVALRLMIPTPPPPSKEHAPRRGPPEPQVQDGAETVKTRSVHEDPQALRGPGGMAWVVLYIPSSTRDWLSRGWCAFARGNCLEEGPGDYCVFELLGLRGS